MNYCFVGIRKYLAESTLHRHEYHQIVLPRVGNLESAPLYSGAALLGDHYEAS